MVMRQQGYQGKQPKGISYNLIYSTMEERRKESSKNTEQKGNKKRTIKKGVTVINTKQEQNRARIKFERTTVNLVT